MRTVQIFISSPGDVAEEREQARRVVDGLQRQYPGVTLRPVLWEELALPATATFQEGIECVLGKPPIDIAVFVLWSRLGTPLGAAIMRPDGSAYRSGTEREFDLMLSAFEQSGRKQPLILAYTRNDDTGFRERLTTAPDSKLEELIAQRRLAEQFIREQFQDKEGRNVRAYCSYREPIGFAERLRVHLRQALDDLLGADASPRWAEEPYRALEVFEVQHAAIFHGREEETCDLLQRLRDQRRAGAAFVLIVGASGSGKSSLIRAGVAASLTQFAADGDAQHWRTVLLMPSLEASDLCGGLVHRLAESLPELATSSTAMADIVAGLKKDAPLTVRLSIAPALARIAEKASGPIHLLVLLDQMEELWTDRRITAEDREQFFNVLEALARTPQVAMLATLRSDFYAQAQQLPALVRLKGERGQYDLLPPDVVALKRLISEPAHLSGLSFEHDALTGRGLDEDILRDAALDPAALPLLEYALSELYRRCDKNSRQLTFSGYRVMGGVEGALGQRAEEIFQAIPTDAQAALDEILPLLVTLDVASELVAVRRRAALSDLKSTPERTTLTDALVTARFLTTDRQNNEPVAGLAHEALLRRWPRIADWIGTNRERLRLRTRVEQSQARWEQQARHNDLLLPPGLPLEEGRQLVRDAPHLLSPQTSAYIRASIIHEDLRMAQSRRRRRVITSVLAVLALVAFIAATIAWSKQQEADRQRILANTRAAEARDQVREASRSDFATAHSRFDEGKWQEAVAYLGRSLRYDPENVDARDALWLALMYGHRDAGRFPLHECPHGSPVTDANFSPDGSRVITASFDSTARIWDATTGQPLGQPLQHKGTVRCASFSPDGSRVVTASEDKTARIWDVRTCQPLSPPLQHQGIVGRANFSPDGSRVVTASEDRTARIWDANTYQPLGPPLQHEHVVNSADFSPDGSRVVTASQDDTARIWDATTCQPLGPPLRHEGPVRIASFSSDGSRVVTAGQDDAARIWDAKTGEPRGLPLKHKQSVWSAGFSPDGSRVVTASDDRTAQIWDATTCQPLGPPLQLNSYVYSASFSPDGSHILTVSDDQAAQLWDATTCQPLGPPLQHKGVVMSARFSPERARVITTGSDGTARIWDASAGPMAGTPLEHKESVYGADFSPDGSRVVTASSDGTARIWNATNCQPFVPPMRHQGTLRTTYFSPDGLRVVTASDDGSAQIWDATTGQRLGPPLEHKDHVNSASFSADGTRVVTASLDHTAQIWDATTGQRLGPPLQHKQGVNSARFSPDGSRVVTGSDDCSAQIWDATTCQPLGPPLQYQGSVESVSFSPDGLRVVAASLDDTARIWDAETGQALGAPLQHKQGIVSANFSPDGSRVITSSFDHTARIWDAKTGQPVGPPLQHRDSVKSASFRPDSSRVVTASLDHTARIWDLLATELPHGALFEQLAGFCAGARLDPQLGTLQEIPLAERTALWQRLEQALADSPGWLFAARSCLPNGSEVLISASSMMTLREAATRLIRTTSAECTHEALAIAPGHPLIQIALAGLEEYADQAKFLREYGVEHLPADAAICREATQMLIDQKDKARAQRALDRAGKLEPNHSDLVALRERVREIPPPPPPGNAEPADSATPPPAKPKTPEPAASGTK